MGTEAKAALPSPPARSRRAEGARLTPMSVTKVPTTTCGNNFITLSMKNDSKKMIAPEAMIEPKSVGKP